MFDKIFMLTLPRTLHGRARETLDHLRYHNLEAEPFIGLDGEVCGLETKFTYELDHPGTGYRIGPKTVSMYLNHMILWKVCKYLPGDVFLILEDDVRFNPDWKEHVDFALPSLPQDWDLLYIGSCCAQDKKPIQVQGHLHRVSYALCTHAYAVRKKALDVLWDACHRIYAGVDIAMCLHAIPQLQTYAFLPRIAQQHNTVISP